MARFKNWLGIQQSRSDLIGKFARAAMADPDFPEENNPTLLSDYLASRGANKRLLKTLQEAFSDFNAFQVAQRENPVPEKKPARKIAAKKPADKKQEDKKTSKEKSTPPKTTAVKNGKAIRKDNSAEAAEAILPAIEEEKAAEQAPAKRRGRPKKETDTTVNAELKIPAMRGRKPKSIIALPSHLSGHKQLLKETALVLDSQFGAGFSENNPVQVIDFAKTLATSDQNNMMKNFIGALAEAMARFTRK